MYSDFTKGIFWDGSAMVEQLPDQFWYEPTLLVLTLKHRETHGCVVSTVATDALVLKHQAISILSTD